jgi:hypothetical protein
VAWRPNVSPTGVRSVWLCHSLHTFRLRLAALERKAAEEGLLLTETQVAALERKREEQQGVRRDRAEVVLLDPIRKGLLSPERVERMAKEMRASYVEHLRSLQMREAERPQELQELTARTERLRARLNSGDRLRTRFRRPSSEPRRRPESLVARTSRLRQP